MWLLRLCGAAPFRFEDESLVVGSDNLAASLCRNGGQDIAPHQPFSSTFSKDCCLARVMALPTAACIHACSTWGYKGPFQLLTPTQHISEVTSELPVGRSRFQLRPKLNVLSLCSSPPLPASFFQRYMSNAFLNPCICASLPGVRS